MWHTPPLSDGDSVEYVPLLGRPRPLGSREPGVIVGDPTGPTGATVQPHDPGRPRWTVSLAEVRRQDT